MTKKESYNKEERVYAPESLEDLNIPDHIESEFGILDTAQVNHIASHIRDYLYCFLGGGDNLYRIGNVVHATREGGRSHLIITVAEVEHE